MSEHRHLRRLERVWITDPIYFITTCTHQRRPILNHERVAKVLVEEWTSARERHGWHVGAYVVMPDHVHFFCAPEGGAKSLPQFMRFWKEWTSKRLRQEADCPVPLWQAEFFDHVLRSRESYGEKWNYVSNNPVRAGLVKTADEWPYAGEINPLRGAWL